MKDIEYAKYILVTTSSYTEESLSEKVNDYIIQGYRPHGSLSVSKYEGQLISVQPMVHESI